MKDNFNLNESKEHTWSHLIKAVQICSPEGSLQTSRCQDETSGSPGPSWSDLALLEGAVGATTRRTLVLRDESIRGSAGSDSSKQCRKTLPTSAG